MCLQNYILKEKSLMRGKVCGHWKISDISYKGQSRGLDGADGESRSTLTHRSTSSSSTTKISLSLSSSISCCFEPIVKKYFHHNFPFGFFLFISWFFRLSFRDFSLVSRSVLGRSLFVYMTIIPKYQIQIIWRQDNHFFFTPKKWRHVHPVQSGRHVVGYIVSFRYIYAQLRMRS
jgi:hypothetical protein